MKLGSLLSGICCLTLASCLSNPAPPTRAKTASGYFPLRVFIADQFRTHLFTPFVLNRTVRVNEAEDISRVDSYTMDWGQVLQYFTEGDIGDSAYRGKYEVSEFDDAATGAHIVYYSAKEPALFTRQMQVRFDLFTHRVLSVYLETERKSFWQRRQRHLYYVAMDYIQIQELDKPLLGREKKLYVDYKFYQ